MTRADDGRTHFYGDGCLPHGHVEARLVEQMVMRPPRGMEGWRMFRIEYGFESSLPEGLVWLAPGVDRDAVERALNGDAT